VNSEFLYDVRPKFRWLGVTTDDNALPMGPSLSSIALKGPLQLNFAARDGVDLFLPKHIESGSIIKRVEIGPGIDNVTLSGAQEIELLKPVDISQIFKAKKDESEGSFKIQLKQAPVLRIGGEHVALRSPSKLSIKSTSSHSSITLINSTADSRPIIPPSTQLQQNGEIEFEVEPSFLESLQNSLRMMHNNKLLDSMAANIKIRITEAKLQPVNYFILSMTLRDQSDGSISQWRADLLRNAWGQNRIVGSHKQDLLSIQDSFSFDLFQNKTGLSTIEEFYKFRGSQAEK